MGWWGGRGSLFEHVQVQVQGAHCLVSIYLPVTHASRGHSSSGGNVDPSSQMPWSSRGRSALCHLFHRVAPAQEDRPPGAEEGGSLPGLARCRQTAKSISSQSHPLNTLTPGLHPASRSTSVASLPRYHGDSPAHFQVQTTEMLPKSDEA